MWRKKAAIAAHFPQRRQRTAEGNIVALTGETPILPPQFAPRPAAMGARGPLAAPPAFNAGGKGKAALNA